MHFLTPKSGLGGYNEEESPVWCVRPSKTQQMYPNNEMRKPSLLNAKNAYETCIEEEINAIK